MKVSQRRQTILVIFSRSGCLAQIIANVTLSQNLTLQEAFETVAHIKEELKRTEFHDAFCKKNHTSCQ